MSGESGVIEKRSTCKAVVKYDLTADCGVSPYLHKVVIALSYEVSLLGCVMRYIHKLS